MQHQKNKKNQKALEQNVQVQQFEVGKPGPNQNTQIVVFRDQPIKANKATRNYVDNQVVKRQINQGIDQLQYDMQQYRQKALKKQFEKTMVIDDINNLWPTLTGMQVDPGIQNLRSYYRKVTCKAQMQLIKMCDKARVRARNGRYPASYKSFVERITGKTMTQLQCNAFLDQLIGQMSLQMNYFPFEDKLLRIKMTEILTGYFILKDQQILKSMMKSLSNYMQSMNPSVGAMVLNSQN